MNCCMLGVGSTFWIRSLGAERIVREGSLAWFFRLCLVPLGLHFLWLTLSSSS